MAAGSDFQGITPYAAAQHPYANPRHQSQRQELPGGPPLAPHGADFAAATGGQFVKTNFSSQSKVVG